MAASASIAVSPPLLLASSSLRKTHFKILPAQLYSPTTRSYPYLLRSNSQNSFHFPLLLTKTRASSNGVFDTPHNKSTEDEILPSFERKPVKFLFWVVLWASLSLVWYAASGDANAAADSIRASSFGLKVARSLRSLGLPDEAVVFTLATFPILELRGAIPVGYWMQLSPTLLTILSILGLALIFILFN